MQQSTQTVVMVRPIAFGFNSETAEDNAYQSKTDADASTITTNALTEFDAMVSKLTDNGVNVLLLESPQHTTCKDAVFPNNWFSTHFINKTRQVLIYPMLSANRQQEVDISALSELLNNTHPVHQFIDLREETTHAVLEGTGSMVLDRINKRIYAAISSRTDKGLLDMVAKQFDYELVSFSTCDPTSMLPIYHTNVLLSIGDEFACLCTEVISDEKERNIVLSKLREHNKVLIDISLSQMKQMAGNILQLRNKNNESLIVLSTSAEATFSDEQKQRLLEFGKLLPISIPTIEKIGGGSVRCMLAEVF